MKIRITGGTYGWRDEFRRVHSKYPGDECEVSETEGARLCSLGIAEPADGKTFTAAPKTTEKKQPDAAEETGGEDDGEELPGRDTLTKMTVAQLRKLCVAEGMDEADAKRATKAACLDYLAPVPDMTGGDAGDIIV